MVAIIVVYIVHTTTTIATTTMHLADAPGVHGGTATVLAVNLCAHFEVSDLFLARSAYAESFDTRLGVAIVVSIRFGSVRCGSVRFGSVRAATIHD
jgi:hypothetical protein